MKKIIFILVLLLCCFFIYNLTSTNKESYISIGDSLARGNTPYNSSGYGYSDYLRKYLQDNNKLAYYNKGFTDKDYRIIDLIRIIKDNETLMYDAKETTVNHLLKKATILTISTGMNELYFKLNINTDNTYSYIDNMIHDYNNLLKEISKYEIKKVLIIGYYNITSKNDIYFDYANHKLKELCKKYDYIFIDTSKLFKDKTKYFENYNRFNPNTLGYYEIYKKILENIE